MKKTVTITLLTTLILLFIGVIFNVYFYSTAKDSYCVAQARQEFPEERGTPSQEWFTFYDECLDSLTVGQTLSLIFQDN